MTEAKIDMSKMRNRRYNMKMTVLDVSRATMTSYMEQHKRWWRNERRTWRRRVWRRLWTREGDPALGLWTCFRATVTLALDRYNEALLEDADVREDCVVAYGPQRHVSHHDFGDGLAWEYLVVSGWSFAIGEDSSL